MTTNAIDDLIQECYLLEHAGKMHLALRRGIDAERLARSLGEIDLAASALAAQALVQAHLGHYPRARTLAEYALDCASPTALGRAEAYVALGICASETDDLDAAEAHYHAAVDLSREIGHFQTLLRALHDLGCGIYYPRGQFALAITTEQEVLQIAGQQGITLYQEYAWTAQALVYLATGDSSRAEEALNNLERLLSPDSRLKGYYHCLSGHHHQMAGNLEAAPACYAQALALAETVGDPGLNVEIRLGMSSYHRVQVDLPAASHWADTAVEAASRSGYHHLEGRALIERGRVAWEMGNLVTAQDDFHRALRRLEPLKANFDLSHAWLMLSALMHQASNVQKREADEARQSWINAAQGIMDGGYDYLLERDWKLTFPLITAYLNDPHPQAARLASDAMALLQRTPPPLRVNTLDRFEVRQGVRVIPSFEWRNRQAGELFRLLLISPGRRLFRDQIIEAMWPEKSPDAARAFLHQTTSALRRVLEPDLPEKFPSRYLFVEEGLVTLRLPPGSQVDFETFEQCIQKGELDAALDLFRGEPFPLDMYHDWVAASREQLNQQYIKVLLDVSRQKLLAGDPQGALKSCYRLLSIDPWQEQAVLTGMQACILLKDRMGAIRLYTELVRSLQEDLSVAPIPELRQLYQSLL